MNGGYLDWEVETVPPLLLCTPLSPKGASCQLENRQHELEKVSPVTHPTAKRVVPKGKFRHVTTTGPSGPKFNALPLGFDLKTLRASKMDKTAEEKGQNGSIGEPTFTT